MRRPQILPPHLILQLAHKALQRLLQRRERQLRVQKIQRLHIFPHKLVSPVQLLLELRLSPEIPRHSHTPPTTTAPHPTRGQPSVRSSTLFRLSTTPPPPSRPPRVSAAYKPSRRAIIRRMTWRAAASSGSDKSPRPFSHKACHR